MMQHMLHAFLLVAIQLLICPKPGRAIVYNEVEINVSTTWQLLERYHNYNTETVVRKITHTSGTKERISDTRNIEATHEAGVIAKGQAFKILELTVSYNFAHRSESVTMFEDEIKESRTSETTVTIPPKSTLTRWELVADVAGTKIGYYDSFDKLNDTLAPTDTPIGRARVLVIQPINYGHTRIRIKHLAQQKYITVTNRASETAATLGYPSNYLFVLCQYSGEIRIKTLNSTDPGNVYVSAYSEDDTWIRFSYPTSNWSPARLFHCEDKERWIISKDEPLYDGDVVTFRNKCYQNSFVCFHHDSDSNVYSCKGLEDRWVLEAVSAEDDPNDNCN